MNSFPFVTGLSLGFSLIIAIGGQNIFVLNQGMTRRHVLPVVLFCSLADVILIASGIAGASVLIGDFALRYKPQIFGFAAIWLAGYGVLKLKAVFSVRMLDARFDVKSGALFPTLGYAFLVTFGNPQVYLDTVGLIGALSLQFSGAQKILYGCGASLASVIFFFSLGYFATLVGPFMERPGAWRVLDLVISLILFFLSFGMLEAGGWFIS
jgi:L-lysine exporter family protein LysE/ArgO